MTDLAAQILAALDRAEEMARAATPGPWARAGWDPNLVLPEAWANDDTDPADRGEFVAIHATRDAAHIAANDPAHVLRLCAALREVVKLADEATSMDMSLDQEFATKPRDGVSDPYLGDRFLAALASVWDVPGVAE